MSACIHNGEQLKITLYEGGIPAFIEPEIEHLYGSLFSSFANFRADGNIPHASVFIASHDEHIKAIFLFRNDKNKIHVLNEGMTLGQAEINLFTEYIFGTFPDVRKVIFHAVKPDFSQLSFPNHQSWCHEDIIVKLPRTVEDYTASLGSSTRKTIKNRISRLKRSFPTFHFECYEKDAVSEQHVRDIINLSKARMKEKSKAWGMDDKETQRIFALVKETGFVSVATINDQVCGGAITFRVGENIFSRVNAHNPAYNDYKLGMVCCYLTICQCIERGAKEFHLGPGRYEYKYALQGVLNALVRVSIYRSNRHFFLDCPSLLRETLKSEVTKATLSLKYEADYKSGKKADAARLCIKSAQCLKRAGKNVFGFTKNIFSPLYQGKT